MAEQNDKKLRVILCRPGKLAETIEMEDSLEAMQELVGGLIEEYMPWEDEVAIICNDEGKMMGLPLNRGITDEEGHLQDIIAGDFFICYAPIESEKFLSMPPELEEKYSTALRSRMDISSTDADRTQNCSVTLPTASALSMDCRSSRNLKADG